MADTKISALTALTGAGLDASADVLAVVDTSVTTTKKITYQELVNGVSTLGVLSAASTDAAADIIPIYDNDATLAKKITVAQLLTLGSNTAATQADQETATSTTAYVSPGRQQYHPSAPKAWGFITIPTTVSASYPAAGVSVAKNGAGNYTITHGITLSSTSYCVLVTPISSSAFYADVTARTTTTFTVIFPDSAGAPNDPTGFNYAIFGDLP